MWGIRLRGGLGFSISSFPGMVVLTRVFHWLIVDLCYGLILYLGCVRLGNPKKDLQNCSREQWSSFY